MVKAILLVLVGAFVSAVFAEVKPSAEPWLKSGETLLVFGDSLTASKRGYVARLEESLGKRGIKVVNGGLGGDKTPMALTRLARTVSGAKPDAILLFFGANDAVIGRGRWRDEPLVSPDAYRDNLVWMVHFCRLKTSVRKFSIAPPTGRMEGVPATEFGDVRAPYLQAARDAADRTDAVFVPLDEAFDAVRAGLHPDERGCMLTEDGIHPNARGAQLIADTLLKYWNLDR